MSQPLTHTPLNALHHHLAARMIAFAGFQLPLHYPTGIRKEHLHCRRAASLFDVSHMGQLELPYTETNLTALEKLLPLDLQQLEPGEQRYTLLLAEDGGIVDDLLLSHDQKKITLIVNAACREQDFTLINHILPDPTGLHFCDHRALLALQGPMANEVLNHEIAGCTELAFMQRASFIWQGCRVDVGRSGYTGEDGFEIAIDGTKAQEFALKLLQHDAVQPAGLGARDSLRLEAGLCLYGQDIDTTRSPISAGLGFCISKSRRPDGSRPGGFNGAQRIARESKHSPELRRYGLVFKGKGMVERNASIITQNEHEVGVITSSGYSFCRGEAIAIGYLQSDVVASGLPLFCRKRGKLQPIEVTSLPFVPPHHLGV